ncbi:hypothetical protein QJS66_14995 [Kocuria rhizophila]|nr:hypothetical protein QJS66_14995 [Kocuria rhizophila]
MDQYQWRSHHHVRRVRRPPTAPLCCRERRCSFREPQHADLPDLVRVVAQSGNGAVPEPHRDTAAGERGGGDVPGRSTNTSLERGFSVVDRETDACSSAT